MAESQVQKMCEDGQLNTMRERGGRWACYRNCALDSAGSGACVFLKFGPGCTFEAPPKHAPDGVHGTGWKYLLLGEVDLQTGQLIVGGDIAPATPELT